MLVGKEST